MLLATVKTNAQGEIELAELKRTINRLAGSQSAKGGASQAGDAASQSGGIVKETIMLPMSDGVRLATDVYRPQGKGPWPVIFTRTPYNRVKAQGLAAQFVPSGYVVVAQDHRGRFESEGENIPFVACGWGEHQDGCESIAWINKQPWANGKLGTVGASAGGITQNLLAGAAPAGLTAQHITVAPASLYHQASYIGGALVKAQSEGWTQGNQFDAKALQLLYDHPTYDDHWRLYDTTLKFPVMNTPAVHVGGWFDTFAQGTIDSFVGRQHHGAEGARGKQKLVMGPWTHGVGRIHEDAELVFPHAEVPRQYEPRRWFEYHLAGVDNGVMREPAVAYYVLGDTSYPSAPGNEWRFADDWPIPSRATPYYLRSGGKLSPSRPEDSDAFAQYTFDPAKPAPTIGGNNLNITKGPKNQHALESRSDVLLFTTEPLAAPLEVTGRITAKIFVASSAVDSDVSVRLCDVYPDGKSYNMAEGMLRLRYRKSFEKPEPLVPGEIVEATVDCWSTSLVFNRGHRLRVLVTASNSPRFDVNPGTGKPWVEGEPSVRQTNKIYCDAAHASCIILPVVDSSVAAN
jgi:hypothetical protein